MSRLLYSMLSMQIIYLLKKAQILIIEYALIVNINIFLEWLFLMESAFYQIKNCIHMNELNL